jgi:ribosomal silencing factor RsfS
MTIRPSGRKNIMAKHSVTIFKAYDFTPGQKIRIEGGKRSGDWEVIDVSDAKVTLRCPISRREFEWARFCYEVEEREDAWPLV